MPEKKIRFKRTEQVAKSERITKWDLIAAIAEDADEAGIPISGAASRMAAKSALEAAGNEYSHSTLNQFCILAKFDFESTNAQRSIWRRYGTSVPLQFVMAGWSQSAAADFLRNERKSYRDAREAVAATATPRSSARRASFDERCAQWVQRVARLMHDGALLLEESEAVDAVGGHAELALMIYQKLADKYLDAELRQLLDSEAAR